MMDYFENRKTLADCSKYELSRILYLLLDEGCLELWGTSIDDEKSVSKKHKIMFLEFMRDNAQYYDEYFFKTVRLEFPSKKVIEASDYFLNLSSSVQLRYR